jgi:hypothetical protein
MRSRISSNRADRPARAGGFGVVEAGSTELLGIVLLTIAIVGLFYVVTFIAAPAIHKTAFERGACGALREIGSNQLAYQSSNNEKAYGSFEAFKQSGYIDRHETLGSLIKGYTVSWEISKPWGGIRGGTICGGIAWNRFTVVAHPRPGFRKTLRTFGIPEDQIVRVYDPSSGSIRGSLRTWRKLPY